VSDTPSQDTGFTAALKREFLLYRARAADILISLSVLAISMVVVSSLFSAGTLRDMPIAVIDQDNSSLSRTYIRMLDASPEMEVVDSLVSPLEARELLEQASIYAFVVVPKDFRKDLKAGRQTTVVAWHSGQFLTVSGNIMKSLTAVTATMSAGANMTALEMQGESRFAADVNFMPIQAELRTLFNPFHNYQYFLVAGLLPAMLQVFVMIWTVYLVGLEFQNGTAGKWQATAGNVVNAVMAKVLPIFVLSSVIGLLCLIWLFAIAAWPIAGSLPLLIVAWILMIAAYIVLGLVFACFAPKLATALSVAVFFTAPAFAYAGVTFPQQAMPLLAQFWTYILPIKSLLKLQIEQVEIGASLANSMPEIFILLAFIVLPLPLALYKISARSRALQASA
jgi:ABC-2 type transport system permease protein